MSSLMASSFGAIAIAIVLVAVVQVNDIFDLS